jgi:maltose O-acetyltransferase
MLGRLRRARERLLGRRSVEWYRRNGCQIGVDVLLGPGCLLDPPHCWLIEIGDAAQLGPNVVVLAHDASTKPYLGYTRIDNVRIGRRVFLGANCVVLPGVTIGDGAIVGAASTVTSDIRAGGLAVGSPARVIGDVSDYIDRQRDALARLPVFDSGWTTRTGVTAARKQQMRERLGDAGGFVV